MIDIIDYAATGREALLARREEEAPDVSAAVGEILADVRQRGDAAVLDYSEKFDGVRPQNLLVSEEEMAEARRLAGPELLAVFEEAAANIRAFHQKQLRQGFVMAERPGVVMGQKLTALERVGVYVPGGTAAYPSTVLMDVIPAQIAGVDEIVIVTPPGPGGKVNPAILAAAGLAGAGRIFKAGGAQAVAALAYGTASIPRVDKIVGPGNIYVATAKKMVYGQVDIDMIAGPSDVLVIADAGANAEAVAADMLAQAEHDPNAAAVLITTSRALAMAVQKALPRRLAALPRASIAEASIRANGRIILTSSLAEAMEVANALAPEHLELCVEAPFDWLPLVRNAGSIFLGHHTPEALGDYFAGPNHTLPTGGTARFYSPLSVDDFVKKSSFLSYSQEALANAAGKVMAFARSEGLNAHAESVAVRLEEGGE